MDRSDAATVLFQWQFDEERDLLGATAQPNDRPLAALVETAAASWHPKPPTPRARPPVEFLRLDEETAMERLRRRAEALTSLLRPGEGELFHEFFDRGLVPLGAIARCREDLDRVASRRTRVVIQEEFEAHWGGRPPRGAPALVRALLLFARDGRLVGKDGPAEGLDVAALSQVVARGEPGSTWSLAHRVGTLVGHLGARTALVAVFPSRPPGTAGGTLRVSVTSLEDRGKLVGALGQPASHAPVSAYLRAVRMLLSKAA